MPIEYPLEDLFRMYCNYGEDRMDKNNEKFDSILLSQLDAWFEKAKLFKDLFTTTDTGVLYIRYNKWRLNYEDFLELLDDICRKKGQDVDKIKKDLSFAGLPD